MYVFDLCSFTTSSGQTVIPDTTSAGFQLLKAVEKGDSAYFNALMRENPDLESVTEPTRNETLLHIAARYNQPEMVKILINKGLNINASNQAGNTPLHLAVFSGSYALIELLFKHGADYQLRNQRGRTALEYVSYGKNPQIYNLFLAKDKDILRYKSAEGAGLLHWAATAADTAGFSFLLAKGLNARAEDNNGSNVVHWAYSSGDKTMLLYLKNKGLDYNLVSSQGYSPITVAMLQKNLKTIEFLLENGLPVNHKFPPENSTLFIEACNQGAVEIAAYLVAKGADVNAVDANGFSALCWSVNNNRPLITTFLLEKGANVNITTNDGRTPLLIALQRDSLPVINQLAEHGADFKSVDSSGMSAIHIAVIQGNLLLTEYLIGKDAPTGLKDQYGLTPVHYAAIYGRSAIAKALIKSGVDVNPVDNMKFTPLYYASLYGQADVKSLLLKAGAEKSREEPQNPSLTSKLKNGESIVHYLNHSAYAIETANHFLVFDYFHFLAPPDQPSLQNGRIVPEQLNGKQIVVFVSHDHGDHYDTSIWNWKLVRPDIKYVLGFRPDVAPAYEFIEPRQTKTIGEVRVTAIKSTDAGVGFLAEVDGIVVFHPGDHVNKAREIADDFRAEIDYLESLHKTVDFAFFPVTGCGFPDAISVKNGNLFAIQKLNPAVCFPMHAGIAECEAFATNIKEKFTGKLTFYGKYPGDSLIYTGN